MKNLILMCVAFIGTLYIRAGTEVDGVVWSYYVYDGTVVLKWVNEISLYTPNHPCVPVGTSGDIIIPSAFSNYPVVSIEDRAFLGCYSITSVTIPNSVTNIGSGVFSGCTSLENVTIPNSVTEIGYDAFKGCSKLKDITIPNSVTNIRSRAFEGCSALRSIKILNGIVNVGTKVFPSCMPGSVTLPGSSLGINLSAITNLVISDGSTSVHGFSGLESLVNVTIPNSVEYIGRATFKECSALSCITIPQSVTNIGSEAFFDCSSITNITIDNAVANIEYSAFQGCQSLENVSLGGSIKFIGNSAFYYCRSLKSVTIPESVTKIGTSVFYGCSSLKRVTMSDSVKSIGSSAFFGCSSLTDINGLPQGVCTGKVSKVFPSYQSITNIVVADGVTRIAAECFKDCLSLKKIVIPASVSVIYDNAFQNCAALEEIVFLGDAPDVGNDILLGTPRSLKITVKEGSVGWKGGVSTELPEAWPVGDATARGIAYYDDSADVAAMTPVITPADGSIFADTCEVSISCAMEGAKIYYRTDGKTPKFTDAYLYKGAFTISDTSKIVAVAVKEGVENGIATATLTKRVLTLAEAAGDADLTFTTGGAADWVPIGDLTATDGVSARSGAVGDEEESWMELSVQGSGTLTFNWKVSCEDDPVSATWDHLIVFVDGKEREDLCFDGEMGWENASIVFDSEGNHTVRWVYVKDESDSEGADCAWISSVNWAPTLFGDITVDIGEGKSVVVPTEWIDKYESLVTAAGGDKVAALMRTAANGRKVWECFMLGVDPTKADDDFKITRFWMEGGKPMFEFSHSTDGAGKSFVPRIKVKGKAKLSDGWSDVPEGGNSTFRFFTVEVELP